MENEAPQSLEPTPSHPAKESHAPKTKSQDFGRFLAELIRTALVVTILAYLLRLYVIEPFVVEGSSMSPTFETNDFLIVDKLSYRFHDPSRGDIIVFKYPYDLSVNYIKRVIGLPGDTVRIANNEVTIIDKTHPNGVILSEPYLASTAFTALPSSTSKDEFLVPTNEYFVLGDNRPGSSDSRDWGFLPKEDIIGKVDVEVYPLNKMKIVHSASYDNF